jgi:hypothetical protein
MLCFISNFSGLLLLAISGVPQYPNIAHGTEMEGQSACHTLHSFRQVKKPFNLSTSLNINELVYFPSQPNYAVNS